MLAEVVHVVQVEQGSSGRRDQNLPPMAGRCDAGCAVNVVADVTLLGDKRSAGVDAHPHPDRSRR